MNNHWLDEAKKQLEVESNRDSDVRFDRLKELGIINGLGEVTGHIHRWDAFLAITEVKPVARTGEIAEFRCLKPVFGMPGGEPPLCVSRRNMVEYLRQGKKVITARRDERLEMWKEVSCVHLSTNGFIRIDSDDDAKDFVGNLPEFQQSNSRL